jgi:hypothetical protein
MTKAEFSRRATEMKINRHVKTFGFLLFMMILFTALPASANTITVRYVAPGGSDTNDCITPTTPCATIDGAIGKASSGYTVKVAIGTYTGSGTDVVLANKSLTISGGWDTGFSSQTGMSTIDGQNTRRGITVTSSTTVVFERFIISNGKSIDGGGISNGGNLTLNTCEISGNSATGDVNSEGGGIVTGSTSTVTINDSTISDNTATSGGGIFSAWGTIYLNNSTISGNIANGGGGVNNLGGTVTINNSTFSNNSVVTMGGGGIRNEASGTVTIQNSLIAKNLGSLGPDCNGDITSAGYNLIGDTSGCTFSSSTGDLTDINPRLGSLTDNGGPTSTHALNPGSPALDGGNNATCLSTDQRGESRPFDGDGDGTATCDIGAFEAQAYIPTKVKQVKASDGTYFSKVGITWLPTSVPKRFDIYRSETLSGAKDNIGSTTALSFNDKTAVKGQRYYYWVKACHLSNCSPYSTHDTGWRKMRKTFRSMPIPDGWVLESSEYSGQGGSINSTQTTIRMGDDGSDRQYCAILSFNTKTIPDSAVVTSAVMKMKMTRIVGTDPFTTHGSLLVAIRKGRFGSKAGLEIVDFQAPASASRVARVSRIGSTSWYEANLKSSSFMYINHTGLTQLRLCFAQGDNDDMSADYIKFFSGNISSTASRPKLEFIYYNP